MVASRLGGRYVKYAAHLPMFDIRTVVDYLKIAIYNSISVSILAAIMLEHKGGV